jgi:hypothetical protein
MQRQTGYPTPQERECCRLFASKPIQQADENAPLTAGQCFITPAGNLTPIRRIAHVVSSKDSAQVQTEISNCLLTVDAQLDNILSIAIPFCVDHGSNTFWDISQQYANAVNDFDASRTGQLRALTKIDFVCQDLTAASVLQTVFKTLYTWHSRTGCY